MGRSPANRSGPSGWDGPHVAAAQYASAPNSSTFVATVIRCAEKPSDWRFKGCSRVNQVRLRRLALRLFFALWPDADAAARLAGIAAGLTVHAPGRRVHPKNHHVTLAFLGEVPDSQLAMLQR